MSESTPPPSGPMSHSTPDRDATSRLLDLCLPEERRPVDDLIDRLRAPDGASWIGAAIATLARDDEPVDESIVEVPRDMPRLVAIKNTGSRLAGNRVDPEVRMTGIAIYFIAVAAALVHHRELISSRDREEIDGILVDLGDAMPEPWGDLMSRAAMAGE